MADSNIMDWDDVIEDDGTEFITLDEGDYNFTVSGFERGRYPGSAKIPACNKATLTLRVETDQGVASVRTDLILYRTLEWKISSFFRCIGMKKQGDRLVMDWDHVTDREGRAHFIQREGTGNSAGRIFNDVDKFYDYDPKFFDSKKTSAKASKPKAQKAPKAEKAESDDDFMNIPEEAGFFPFD